MQLRAEQLERHLQGALAPVYLASGDEPLQLEECTDQIRAAARARGFTEREVLFVEPGFEWGTLAASGASLSLFAERKVIDLRLASGKPGEAGSKALVDYLGHASPDNVLLITTGQLEARARRSAWYQAVERAGVAIQIWPVDPARLPRWIQRRAHARGWRFTEEAAAELALRVEGNLLACAQDIELLGLLRGRDPIDADTVLSVAADRARFDTFDLVDALLAGEPGRGLRILRGLRAEGTVPTVVAGTVAWAARALAGFAEAPGGPGSVERAVRANPVWNRRRELVARALSRHRSAFWREALVRLAAVDAMGKGARPGDPWEALGRLALEMAGLVLARRPSL